MSIFLSMQKNCELTGVPGSGKSTYVIKEKLTVQSSESLFPILYKLPYKAAVIFSELYLFLLGFKVLSIIELNFFFKIAMREQVSISFKLNIFRNTLRKFAIYYLTLRHYDSKVYIDEGISHIPFSHTSSSFEEIFPIIEPYLKNTSLIYIRCTSDEELKRRLLHRGHSRLKFISVEKLILKSRKVEAKMLEAYPLLCKSFKVVDNA